MLVWDVCNVSDLQQWPYVFQYAVYVSLLVKVSIIQCIFSSPVKYNLSALTLS